MVVVASERLCRDVSMRRIAVRLRVGLHVCFHYENDAKTLSRCFNETHRRAFARWLARLFPLRERCLCHMVEKISPEIRPRV